MKTIKQILEDIEKTVCGDRMKTHGDPYAQFELTAKLWTAWTGVPLSRTDVAIMKGMDKDSRSKFGAYNFDDHFDKVGYAAIQAHVADRERPQLTVGKGVSIDSESVDIEWSGVKPVDRELISKARASEYPTERCTNGQLHVWDIREPKRVCKVCGIVLKGNLVPGDYLAKEHFWVYEAPGISFCKSCGLSGDEWTKFSYCPGTPKAKSSEV